MYEGTNSDKVALQEIFDEPSNVVNKPLKADNQHFYARDITDTSLGISDIGFLACFLLYWYRPYQHFYQH